MRYTTIKDLISNPARSRHREYLLTTQFIRDMVLAAGNVGYNLLVYLPTVDSDGFDVILDDRHRLRPFQLKSAKVQGKVAGWSVHKTLLWPNPEDAELYGLNPNWSEHGRGGAVVLVRAAIQEGQLVPHYYYTDIDVLAAIWYAVWPLPVPQRRRVDRLQPELSDTSNLKIVLPRSAFLPVASCDHLLAIAGLTAEIEVDWRSALRMALRTRKAAIPSGDLDAQKSRWAYSELQELVSKPGLRRHARTKREEVRNLIQESNQTLYHMERLVDVMNASQVARKASRRK